MPYHILCLTFKVWLSRAHTKNHNYACQNHILHDIRNKNKL